MKMVRVAVFLVLALPAAAFADICSDIALSYNTHIANLEMEAQARIQSAPTLEERDAIRAQYDQLISQARLERDSLLQWAGCPVITDPVPPPPPPPPFGCSDAYEVAQSMEAGGASVQEIHRYLHGQGCNSGRYQAGKSARSLGKPL